jgi:hypothetical protein
VSVVLLRRMPIVEARSLQAHLYRTDCEGTARKLYRPGVARRNGSCASGWFNSGTQMYPGSLVPLSGCNFAPKECSTRVPGPELIHCNPSQVRDDYSGAYDLLNFHERLARGDFFGKFAVVGKLIRYCGRRDENGPPIVDI